jgi:hypothetical protein
MMIRLCLLYNIGFLLVWNVNAFIPSVGKAYQLRHPSKNWGIFSIDNNDADVFFDGGDIGMTSDIDAIRDVDDEVIPTPTPVVPEVKKKTPKRKTKAAASTSAVPAETMTSEVQSPSTTPIQSAPAPTTTALPSKIYYRAKENNIPYAVSSISIGNAVVTLKDLKKILLEANEWSDASTVIFYKNTATTTASSNSNNAFPPPDDGERLAYTTELHDCLLDNTYDNPLYVGILTTSNVAAATAPTTQAQNYLISQPEREEGTCNVFTLFL